MRIAKALIVCPAVTLTDPPIPKVRAAALRDADAIMSYPVRRSFLEKLCCLRISRLRRYFFKCQDELLVSGPGGHVKL